MEPTREALVNALQTAQQDALKQDFAGALRKYHWVEKHIQDDPENLPPLRIEMGWAYYHLQQYPQAIACFEKALESPQLTPQQAFDARRLIGFSHEAAGNYRQATENLELALQQPVDDATRRYALFELGKIYFMQKRMQQALPLLERAMPLFDDSEHEYRQTSRYYIGFALFFQKLYREAEIYFLDYIANAADAAGQSAGWFGIAHLHYEQQDFTELEAICQKIIKDSPAFFDKETVAYFLCKSYAALGNQEKLRIFLPELIQNYPRGRYATEYANLKRSLS
jgi:tetratricopeptide (TPR) repeat protein